MVISLYLTTVGPKNKVKYFVDNLGPVFNCYLCKKTRWHLLEDQADPEKKPRKTKDYGKL